MIKAEIQYAVNFSDIPTKEQFQSWAAAIESTNDQEVTIRIVDEAEITELNNVYRKKPQATNVLAFPADIPAEIELPLIGDIAICAPIVAQQAAEQGKSVVSHWAHLTLHGILHLQGYDHIDDAEAKIMENLEVQLMSKLGFPNPYV